MKKIILIFRGNSFGTLNDVISVRQVDTRLFLNAQITHRSVLPSNKLVSFACYSQCESCSSAAAGTFYSHGAVLGRTSAILAAARRVLGHTCTLNVGCKRNEHKKLYMLFDLIDTTEGAAEALLLHFPFEAEFRSVA